MSIPEVALRTVGSTTQGECKPIRLLFAFDHAQASSPVSLTMLPAFDYGKSHTRTQPGAPAYMKRLGGDTLNTRFLPRRSGAKIQSQGKSSGIQAT